MKKFLRFVGLLLLLLIVVVLVIGLVAPKDITVERTVEIKAPQSVVAAHMLQYKNFSHWSPWQDNDPAMKSEVTGHDGMKGAIYTWHGNKDVGKGEMTVTERTDNETEGKKMSAIDYQLAFKEPWESNAKGVWSVVETGPGTSKATWSFSTHAGFPTNAFLMIMGMKKYLQKDFDKGLNRLKEYSEKHAQDAGQVMATRFPAQTYATIRKTIGNDDASMMKFFSESYPALGKAAGAKIAGPAAALTYTWDEQNHMTDVAAAFPVNSGDSIQGATIVQVPASKAYMTQLRGGYSGMMEAHKAVNEYLASLKLQPKLVVEEYLRGMQEEQDSTRWVTNIYYLVD